MKNEGEEGGSCIKVGNKLRNVMLRIPSSHEIRIECLVIVSRSSEYLSQSVRICQVRTSVGGLKGNASAVCEPFLPRVTVSGDVLIPLESSSKPRPFIHFLFLSFIFSSSCTSGLSFKFVSAVC